MLFVEDEVKVLVCEVCETIENGSFTLSAFLPTMSKGDWFCWGVLSESEGESRRS